MTDSDTRFSDIAETFTPVDLLTLPTVRSEDHTEAEVLIHPLPRSLTVRYASVDAVQRVLADAQIGYFAVPGFSPYGATLGVLADDRDATIEAIRNTTVSADRPAHVRQLTPAPATSQHGLTSTSIDISRQLKNAKVIRVWWSVADPTLSHVFGASHGVEIEFWTRDEWREGVHSFVALSDEDRHHRLVAPRPNRAAKIITDESGQVEIDASAFTRLSNHRRPSGIRLSARSQLVQDLPDQVRFPIDVVYTWVDGNDPRWAQRRAAYSGEPVHSEADALSRFVNRDELRYSLRSLYANAPWINRVYIVTDAQSPDWLRAGDGVEIIDHREIFPDLSVLPVFNSHAIEANLHRIPNLSEHFLYFNDDMFLGRPVLPSKFFFPNGLAKFFPSPTRVPFTERSALDSPVDAATKNVRDLIKDSFGVSIAQVMEHAPYPLLKSVIAEMADRYGEAFAKTTAARFRSPTDVNVPSNFAHHYAFNVGRAVASSLSFSYIGLSVRDLQLRLDRLRMRRDADAFCLNDTFTADTDLEAQLDVVRPFLDAYFPIASPWEK
nr:stealth family protein [Microbacterium bovistercoris]